MPSLVLFISNILSLQALDVVGDLSPSIHPQQYFGDESPRMSGVGDTGPIVGIPPTLIFII